MSSRLFLILKKASVGYNNYIIPVCLPLAAVDLTGKIGWLTGWGIFNKFITYNYKYLIIFL